MKKIITFIMIATCIVTLAGCKQTVKSADGKKVSSTIDRVLAKKKLVIGTAPGYLPFEMKDKNGKFFGYDIDLGNAMGEALKVPVEFKQFGFSGLISAIQTGDIDMVLAGMTIRGDRALAASFSNPYYATGQVLMVSAKDETIKSWEDLDVAGKIIATSQGTTGALMAKQLFQKAKVVDFDDFPTACMAIIQGKADGIIYDEPGIKMFEIKNKKSVRGIYNLISAENLGVAVAHNDLETVQWVNSFLESYKGNPKELASVEKWFKSTDWMETVSK